MKKLITCLAFLLLAHDYALASPDQIYLRCPIDGVPTAIGYNLMLDKPKMKLSMMLPGLNPSDFDISETETEYRSIIELHGDVVFKMILNKYTLRLMVFNPTAAYIGGGTTNTAQCSVVDKKI